jgi:hypothetical protein
MDKKEFLEEIVKNSRCIWENKVGISTVQMRNGPKTGLFLLQQFEDGGISVFKESEGNTLQDLYFDLFGTPNSIDLIKN